MRGGHPVGYHRGHRRGAGALDSAGVGSMPHEDLPPVLSRLEPESAEIVRRCLRGELEPEVLLDLVAELEAMNRADPEVSDAIDALYVRLSAKPPSGSV